jgi:hypothetical protein
MFRVFAAGVALASGALAAHAQPVLFADDFSDPAWSTLLWSNQRGNWQLFSGVYGASSPSNNPLTYTALPFVLGDFSIECDVVAADDGGIWLRSDAAGANGVLLVTARGSVYWHNVASGAAGGVINEAPGAYTLGSTFRLRAQVTGSLFRAFVNGNLVTSYTNAVHSSGRVALYDFRHPGHNYDNLVLQGACASGDCCPIVYVPPAGLTACPGEARSIRARFAGSLPSAIQWQAEDPANPGSWVNLPEGEHAAWGLTFGNVATDLLTITPSYSGGSAIVTDLMIRCSGVNACGSGASAPAPYQVLDCCPDVNQDGNADQDDVTYLINVISGGDNPTGIDPDFNRDGNADQDDIAALINVVAGGDCP